MPGTSATLCSVTVSKTTREEMREIKDATGITMHAMLIAAFDAYKNTEEGQVMIKLAQMRIASKGDKK